MSIKFKYEAFQDLIKRYQAVFAHAWQHRQLLTTPALTIDEAEFLPAALSIQAKPVSPVGRAVAKVLMSLIALTFLWSVFGKIDIITTGQGKIVPSGYTKALASIEVAKVTGLYVQEGQQVKQGDTLIELDASITDSEHDKADNDRQLALLNIERSKALLYSIQHGSTPVLPSIDGISQSFLKREELHLQDQWQDFQAKKTRLESQIVRYQEQLPLAQQRAKDYQELAKNHDVAEHAWIEKQQAYLEIQGQLADAKTQLQSVISETRKTAQDEIKDATKLWSESEHDALKAQAHSNQLKITAPVDGTVQQLNVHTVGGVVSAAQPLMMVVPSGKAVEFEAFIENKDIGFIQEGQKAKIKVDTFLYTKYGTIDAVVTHVSRDAIDSSGMSAANNLNKDEKDEKKQNNNLLYSVKLMLDKTDMDIDGKKVALSPGMSGSVEIMTGERRIIEYVLSPLMTHTQESMHER